MGDRGEEEGFDEGAGVIRQEGATQSEDNIHCEVVYHCWEKMLQGECEMLLLSKGLIYEVKMIESGEHRHGFDVDVIRRGLAYRMRELKQVFDERWWIKQETGEWEVGVHPLSIWNEAKQHVEQDEEMVSLHYAGQSGGHLRRSLAVLLEKEDVGDLVIDVAFPFPAISVSWMRHRAVFQQSRRLRSDRIDEKWRMWLEAGDVYQRGCRQKGVEDPERQ